MEFFQINYFFHTATRGGLGPAAKELHVSVPAISKAIARLEDELGCQLFARQGRRLVLTEEGRHFLGRAAEILTLVERAFTELRGPVGVRELVIVGRELLLEPFGLPLGALFRSRHPEGTVRLKCLAGKDALQAVDVGEAQIAVVLESAPQGWRGVALGDIRFVTAVGPGHPLYKAARKGTPVAVKDVCMHGFVSPNLPIFGRIGSSQSLDGWRDDIHPRRIDYTVESLSLYGRLLEDGHGLGYMPDFFAHRHGLAELTVRGCSFQVRQKVYVVAKRAEDFGWLGGLLDAAGKLFVKSAKGS